MVKRHRREGSGAAVTLVVLRTRAYLRNMVVTRPGCEEATAFPAYPRFGRPSSLYLHRSEHEHGRRTDRKRTSSDVSSINGCYNAAPPLETTRVEPPWKMMT